MTRAYAVHRAPGPPHGTLRPAIARGHGAMADVIQQLFCDPPIAIARLGYCGAWIKGTGAVRPALFRAHATRTYSGRPRSSMRRPKPKPRSIKAH